MKTLITTFAIAVMVFAFNPISVMATEQSNEKVKEGIGKFGDGIIESGKWVDCNLGGEGRPVAECNENWKNNVLSENESGETDDDREVADSGDDEGSTSAASAGDQ